MVILPGSRPGAHMVLHKAAGNNIKLVDDTMRASHTVDEGS
jgi:hypothetical protein